MGRGAGRGLTPDLGWDTRREEPNWGNDRAKSERSLHFPYFIAHSCKRHVAFIFPFYSLLSLTSGFPNPADTYASPSLECPDG